MRLIRCKKCGAAICTEDAMIERMSDTIHELNEKARHSKGQIAQSYMQEASSVKKMLVNIIHSTAQIDERKHTKSYELLELLNYIRRNKLIPEDKISEIRESARAKAEAKNKEDQKIIDELYGEYKTKYNPFNNTKRDTTSESAIRNVMKK